MFQLIKQIAHIIRKISGFHYQMFQKLNHLAFALEKKARNLQK